MSAADACGREITRPQAPQETCLKCRRSGPGALAAYGCNCKPSHTGHVSTPVVEGSPATTVTSYTAAAVAGCGAGAMTFTRGLSVRRSTARKKSHAAARLTVHEIGTMT